MSVYEGETYISQSGKNNLTGGIGVNPIQLYRYSSGGVIVAECNPVRTH